MHRTGRTTCLIGGIMDGFNYLNAIKAGTAATAPAAAAMKMTLEVVERGRVHLRMPFQGDYANYLGTLAGGATATLLDMALAGAVISQLPDGLVTATLDFSIDLLRPITVDCAAVTARA